MSNPIHQVWEMLAQQAEPGRTPPSAIVEAETDEQRDRLEAIGTLDALCRLYGYKRVGTWIRNLASIAGEEA